MLSRTTRRSDQKAQRTATSPYGLILHHVQIAVRGGKKTFAAGARRQNVNSESRHSNNLEPRVLSAPPQGGSEPILSIAALRNLDLSNG
jgi:hypothetical protein